MIGLRSGRKVARNSCMRRGENVGILQKVVYTVLSTCRDYVIALSIGGHLWKRHLHIGYRMDRQI